MKKILVPTDFSKNASTAADVAFDIAKKSGASIVMLHVIEEASGGSSFNVEGQVSTSNDMTTKLFTLQMIKKAKAQLEKAVKDPKYSAVKVDGELRMGNAYHGIKTIIAEHKCDLVVMGTTGGTKGVSVGTTTEKVIRGSHCPILTVPAKPAKPDFKNIVYATSMSKDEEVFSRVLKRTQQIYNSTIHLVRINTPADFQPDHEVLAYMEKFSKTLGLKNITLNIFNALSIEEGVNHFADHINADMIAMATHGRTGISHFIAGSVAEAVANIATRPVLTFVVKH